MNRYAIIEDNKVINVIVWDGSSDLSLPFELVNIDGQVVNIGDQYIAGVFIPSQNVEHTESIP